MNLVVIVIVLMVMLGGRNANRAEENKMAGTSTLPPFSGASQSRLLTLFGIDFSGDIWACGIYIDNAATDAQVQAIIDAYQATTKMSLFKVTDRFVYEGASATSNAEAGDRASGAEGVNVLYRDPTLAPPNTMTVRVNAPDELLFSGSTDTVDGTSAVLLALNTAVAAARSGFTADSAQFTTRRESKNNPRSEFA